MLGQIETTLLRRDGGPDTAVDPIENPRPGVPENAVTGGGHTDLSTYEKLEMFCGPNAGPYLRYYRDKYVNRGNRLNFGWSWAAFLFWIPWTFYRKLYLVAFGLIALPVVMGALLPGWTAMPLAGGAIMIYCALCGKRGYIEHALRKIRKIDAKGLPRAERDARIRREGGVSYLTASVATSFWLFLASLPLLAKHIGG